MTKYNLSHKLKFLLTASVLIIVCVFLCLFLFVNDAHSPAKASSASTKTLTQKIWDTMPGAFENQDGTIDFTPIERKIVNQDGSGGQTNPPVNIGGPSLQFKDSFVTTFDVKLSKNASASIRFYKEMPIIYDEWRHEGTSVSVTINKGSATVQAWDSKKETPYVTKSINIESSENHILNIKKTGDALSFYIDTKETYSLNIPELFTMHTLWLGADASQDKWTLKSFTLKEGTLVDTPEPLKQSSPNSLATLAFQKRESLKIGAAISLYPLYSNTAYQKIALNEFSMWTPENEMKAQFIHPMQNVYAFSDADLLVNTAVKNDIRVHGHALVFGEANPTWMQNTPTSELKKVMTDHITTLMKHYQGKVSEWDVINEPLSDDDADYASGGLRRSIWYKAMGENFIAEALKTAYAADPAAKLYINDYGLEADGDRWDALLKIINKLQADNIPLDGIGFQAHVYEDGDEIDEAVLRAHIQKLQSLGLSSRISEIDVHGEDEEFQATQYALVLDTCIKESSCTSFSTWGISDAFGSTTSDHTYPPEFGNDLLWDSSFQPKKAYTHLITLLKK